MPRKSKTAQAPVGQVSLRLVQNAYVRGELLLKGTVVTFSKEEADQRMSKTQYWEYL